MALRSLLAAALGLLACATAALAEPAGTLAVPFVGCRSDGQMGPVAVPPRVPTPKLPPDIAGRLAFYGSAQLAVLAPRGWHCFGLYGSGGSLLLVTPTPHDAHDLLGSAKAIAITGPAVEIQYALGGTSGRFQVAPIAAALFPTARSFVEQVMDEDILPKEAFSPARFAKDRVTRRSDTIVEFETAAGSDGLGTFDRLQKDDRPISGVAVLLPGEDLDLIMVHTRVPPELRDLSPVILTEVERRK